MIMMDIVEKNMIVGIGEKLHISHSQSIPSVERMEASVFSYSGMDCKSTINFTL